MRWKVKEWRSAQEGMDPWIEVIKNDFRSLNISRKCSEQDVAEKDHSWRRIGQPGWQLGVTWVDIPANVTVIFVPLNKNDDDDVDEEDDDDAV